MSFVPTPAQQAAQKAWLDASLRQYLMEQEHIKELKRLRTLEEQLKKFLGAICVTTSTSLEFHDGYDVFRGLNSLEELVKRD